MAKNRSIKQRQLLVLQHLFDDIYTEPVRESGLFLSLENKMENATCSDYYKLVSDGKNQDIANSNYGNKPLPKYIRFNDVVGILYTINNDIRHWKESLSHVIAGGISANDLEEIEYSTLAKELNNLAERDNILVKSDVKNIKRKCFYYPNETVEGYGNLLDYLFLLPYSPNDDFGISCRELAFSHYSRIVLNREFVIENMRNKKMQLRIGGFNNYPYLGRYRKIFECPEALRTFVSICNGLKMSIPDIDCTDSIMFRKTTHQVIDELISEAEVYLERIEKIQSTLSDRKWSADQLSRLHPKEWFVLDPDSKLRCEAQWTMPILNENDERTLLSLYAKYCNKNVEDLSSEEQLAFIKQYISALEMDVLYALSMISNSYWALMYFHLYRYDNFFKIEREGINPYERLPGPSVTNRTGDFGLQDIFWDKQLYRYAMYDYSLGTYTKHPNGPKLMGIGPVEYQGKIIPTTFSFKITPQCFMTASGTLNREDDSDYPLNQMNNASSHKYIEKKVYGDYYSQSYLPSMFKLPHFYGNNMGNVLKQVMLDIDCNGKCSHDSKHYADMFIDEKNAWRNRK